MWSLARLSRQRSTLGPQLGAVDETLADLPPEAEVFQELQRRRVRIEGRLAMLEAEIDNRVEALEQLANESAGFARYTEALDKSLRVIKEVGRLTEFADHYDDPASGMADRVRGLIRAYSELTSRNRAWPGGPEFLPPP